MKIRVLFVVLVIASVLLSACVAAAPQGAAPDRPFRVAVIMPSAINDVAFSQSMWTALKAIQAEMGGESKFEIKYSENMFKLPDATAAIRDYATQGFDLVIAHGSQYVAPAGEIAKDFPKVTFVWGTDTKTFGLPNVYAYTPAAEEGGYVQGIMAAEMTKSKIIGVTGPVEVGDAKSYVNGFVQGVTSVDPNIKINKTWTGSFSDVALMTEAAKTHIQAGADVLTGSSQAAVGAINVAKEAGNVKWFGMQSDQSALAPQNVAASVHYDWAPMLKEIIAARKSGKQGGQTYVMHLKDGGLKIVINSAANVPDDVKKAAEQAIEGIKNGSIKVTP